MGLFPPAGGVGAIPPMPPMPVLPPEPGGGAMGPSFWSISGARFSGSPFSGPLGSGPPGDLMLPSAGVGGEFGGRPFGSAVVSGGGS